jgi:hypothetical protein
VLPPSRLRCAGAPPALPAGVHATSSPRPCRRVTGSPRPCRRTTSPCRRSWRGCVLSRWEDLNRKRRRRRICRRRVIFAARSKQVQATAMATASSSQQTVSATRSLQFLQITNFVFSLL